MYKVRENILLLLPAEMILTKIEKILSPITKSECTLVFKNKIPSDRKCDPKWAKMSNRKKLKKTPIL